MQIMSREALRQFEQLNPAERSQLCGQYIGELASGKVLGQGDVPREAILHEDHDLRDASSPRHWIDYGFTGRTGEEFFVRLQYAGHVPASNIYWRTDRGYVWPFQAPLGRILFYVPTTCDAWYSPNPPSEYCGSHPSMPGFEVRVQTMRASGGWLERFLDGCDEAHAERIRQAVAETEEGLSEVAALPPRTCIDWRDAQYQIEMHAAAGLGEAMMHVFSEMSVALGIQPFNDWLEGHLAANGRPEE